MKRWPGAAFALLLAACAAITPQSGIPPGTPFDLQGRMLVSGEGRAFSSGVRWRYSAAGDELWLMSPLGQTLAHVMADEAGATLTAADQQVYRDATVENLTRRALGWPLPLAQLRHWIRGQPVPGADVTDMVRDEMQRPLRFGQAGWVIRYSYPEASADAASPRRLEIANNAQLIRLVIDQWRDAGRP